MADGKPKDNMASMASKVRGAFETEIPRFGKAAKFEKTQAGLKKSFNEFRGETASTQLALATGVSSSVTLALSGLRSMRNGISKDEDGKRDYGLIGLGAAEFAGGALATTLFVERVLQPNGAKDSNGKPAQGLGI